MCIADLTALKLGQCLKCCREGILHSFSMCVQLSQSCFSFFMLLFWFGICEVKKRAVV